MPQCRITPMANEDSDDRPYTTRSPPSSNIWTSMSAREIVQTLEDFAHQRGNHVLLLDQDVRVYLLALLREHLPRRREASHEIQIEIKNWKTYESPNCGHVATSISTPRRCLAPSMEVDHPFRVRRTDGAD